MLHIMPPLMQPGQRENRLDAIREILSAEAIGSQHDLLQRLAAKGFAATQSSICRDLRELGVAKVRGHYVLASPAALEAPEGLSPLAPLVRGVSPAGPHMLVVRCVAGGAARVGAGIDNAGWREVVGTVAGDDTLFIATASVRARNRVGHLLESLLKEVAHV